jgi:WD40 repeat protein
MGLWPAASRRPSGRAERHKLGQVRVIRVADGNVIHRFTGHLGNIHGVSFSPMGRTLASPGQDTTVLLWDVKAHKDAAKESPPLTPEKLAELWKGLRGTAAEAHVCMCILIAAPGQTVPFLGEKLKPIAALDAERFARLLKKLDSDQFAQREQATQELKKWAMQSSRRCARRFGTSQLWNFGDDCKHSSTIWKGASACVPCGQSKCSNASATKRPAICCGDCPMARQVHG